MNGVYLRTVREAMVKVVLGQTWLSGPEFDRNLPLIEDPGTGTMIPTADNVALSKSSSLSPADPSLCMFWCAVALGGLAAGRPVRRVSSVLRDDRLPKNLLRVELPRISCFVTPRFQTQD